LRCLEDLTPYALDERIEVADTAEDRLVVRYVSSTAASSIGEVDLRLGYSVNPLGNNRKTTPKAENPSPKSTREIDPDAPGTSTARLGRSGS
jgi:hypothetical protein